MQNFRTLPKRREDSGGYEKKIKEAIRGEQNAFDSGHLDPCSAFKPLRPILYGTHRQQRIAFDSRHLDLRSSFKMLRPILYGTHRQQRIVCWDGWCHGPTYYVVSPNST